MRRCLHCGGNVIRIGHETEPRCIQCGREPVKALA